MLKESKHFFDDCYKSYSPLIEQGTDIKVNPHSEQGTDIKVNPHSEQGTDSVIWYGTASQVPSYVSQNTQGKQYIDFINTFR